MIGWMMRGIVLGGKLDECLQCHQVGPHVLVRKTHWFTILGFPVLFLWMSHGLLCPDCGDLQPISLLRARRAMKDGFLRLPRSRASYSAAALEYLGSVEPSDWVAFGVEPGSSPDVLQARYRTLAKNLHPDAGGSHKAFSEMSARYQRLRESASAPRQPGLPEAGALFDPFVTNPRRGAFDLYLKVWPVAALLVVGIWTLNDGRPAAPASTAATRAVPSAALFPMGSASTPTATPTRAPAPRATSAPASVGAVAVPSAASRPTASPTVAPTLPAPPSPAGSLSFGKLTYSRKACWETGRDGDGQEVSGIIVKFNVKATNSGRSTSQRLWFALAPTTVLLPTPRLAAGGNVGNNYWVAPPGFDSVTGGSAIIIRSSGVRANETKSVSFNVYFDSVLDVEYQLWAFLSPGTEPDPDHVDVAIERWDHLSTETELC